MKHFVLFSMLLIAASVIVLTLYTCTDAINTDNPMEGFETEPMEPNPVPATVSNAAAADGTSDQDHLMYNTLNKQERLSKTLESQINGNSNGVSPTTTKKNGIASTGTIVESFQGMSTTCTDKCKSINAADAIRGNCVNPKLPDNNPDYSTKYCPAFLPNPNDPLTYAQECATCGYYKYSSECKKKADPKDPNKCTQYGSYTPSQSSYMTCADDPNCNLFHGVGTQDGTSESTGPTCLAANCAPKEVTIGAKKCIIPGCISMDSGMLPYPMDFYGNDQINPCTGKGANVKCPAITPGTYESYDSAGGSGDLCYTTDGKVDPTKFQSMNQVPICNRVTEHNFVPSQPRQQKDQEQQPHQQQQSQQKDQKQQQKYLERLQRQQKYLERRRQMKRNNVPEPEPGTLYLGIF